jgi:2-oxoglutarate ferredoxin oxidoreductase subunit alpha
MRLNILFGGKAGQGPNILTHTLGRALVRKGFYVFYSRDYQSLIRGGHNFNVLTFSNEPVYSNDSGIDIIVALDDLTEEVHKSKLNQNGLVVKGHNELGNMFFAGRIFKLLGIGFEFLDKELKDLGKRYKENLQSAKKGYDSEKEPAFELDEILQGVLGKENRVFRNGNMGVSEGAINAGLDIYYAYPMTPATPVMGELAEKQIKAHFLVLELENEIAVANAGVGSAITGAKTMVGTSGGGFDLMSEALSLTGQAGVGLVFYLAQRPGPATGPATYTAQGDLNMVRNAGHGEFSRIVLAPGDPVEAEELTSQAFYFSQKFKIPSIVISDKHLAESHFTIDGRAEITKSGKWTEFSRYNSYEKDQYGSATENPAIITRNLNQRLVKKKAIEAEAENFTQYKVFGNRSSENVIIGWGSTKGAIMDVVEDLNCKFVQILYLEPFPKKDLWKELIGKNMILVENNSTGQLGELIKEKIGFNIPDKNKVLRYDGRPFLHNELKKQVEARLKKQGGKG